MLTTSRLLTVCARPPGQKSGSLKSRPAFSFRMQMACLTMIALPQNPIIENAPGYNLIRKTVSLGGSKLWWGVQDNGSVPGSGIPMSGRWLAFPTIFPPTWENIHQVINNKASKLTNGRQAFDYKRIQMHHIEQQFRRLTNGRTRVRHWRYHCM